MYHFLRSFPLLVLIAVLSLKGNFVSSTQVFAQEVQQSDKILSDTVRLDGSEYSREALARAFVEAAFSSAIPLTSWSKYPEQPVIPIAPFEPSAHHPIYNYEGIAFQKQYPWLYEYVFREKGVPRYMAINKWTKNLRVSVGFPNGLKPYQRIVPEGAPHMTDALYQQGLVPVTREIEELVSSEVISFNETVSETIGFNISYLENAKEVLPDHAELRIVFLNDVESWDPDAKVDFRKVRVQVRSGFAALNGGGSMPFRPNFEFDLLPTAVIFTPNAPRQVDGFFLSEADNSIGMSFCFISQKSPEDLKKGLVKECLFRSLGLPDAVYQPASMLSSAWKGSDNRVSFNEYRPMRSVSFEKGAYITEFDLYLLKILYRPEIKPGMSPYEVYRLLMKR